MRLTRFTVNQVKQFRQPLTIADLTDGINLFVGPNESGKSTLVRAIRAAFFERYSSNSAEDLRPWGDSSAAPEIELEFEWQNQHWKLHKRFLNKKRCDLHIGQQHISGAEAEEKLAELLGYQFAGKGASKPEHWGIPGLLWVEQGCIQDIHHSVDHAGHHLKSALSNTLGEVTSTGGDELIAQVESERATLLTKTGQPTGQYKKVIQDCDDYDQKLSELGNKIRDYRSSVDRLGQLQRQRQENDSQKPWLDYRKKAEEAVQALNRELEQRVQNRTAFSITDTGIGLTEEAIAMLGTKFWRAEDDYTRSQPGTGLGFAITRALVEQMGSSIHIASQLGKGSTFTFSVAVAQS